MDGSKTPLIADGLGIDDEQDVVDMVKQIRAERDGNYQHQ